MPWQPSDSSRFTHKAGSPKRKRQWAEVADSMLARTGDEGTAIRAANSVIKKRQKSGQSSRSGRAHHPKHASKRG